MTNPWDMSELDAAEARRLIEAAERNCGWKASIERRSGYDFLIFHDAEIGADIGGASLIRPKDVEAVRALIAGDKAAA